MLKSVFTVLILFVLAGCATTPASVAPNSRDAVGFSLTTTYESIAGIGKFKITIEKGRYLPVYEDRDGYYYQQKIDAPGVFITFDRSTAWIYDVNHDPRNGMIAPVGAVPALIPALMFPPGSVTKVRELKKDFFSMIQWEEKPIQISEVNKQAQN